MQIRRLTPDDAPEYRQLRLRGLLEHPEAFVSSYADEAAQSVEQFAARLGGNGRVTFGAFVDGELIGTAAAYHDRDRGKARHKAWLVAVYVAPEARGRGVGRAVCQAAVDAARGWDGVEQIHLGVAVPNEAAMGLYRSMGFVEYGREPRAIKLPDRYVDELLMVLPLT